jgi:hypothetical protein
MLQPPSVIIPNSECLEQAPLAKKKMPKEVRSQVMAETARIQAEQMTPEERRARAKKAAEGRWGKKRKKATIRADTT